MRIFLFLIFIFQQSFAQAQSKNVLKFEDLKPLVETKNERVHAKAQELSAASAREGSLVRSFLPRAEIFAAQEQFKKGPLETKTQPDYGVEVSVNLYNGGRDRLEEDRRGLQKERRRFEGTLVLSEELAKAREAYWKILFTRDQIELLKEARKTNAENLQSAERRIRSGVATETDRVEFEMQDIDLKRDIERAELEQKNQIRALIVTLGLDENATLEFPENLRHEHDWEKQVAHTESDHAFLTKPAELYAKEAETQASSRRRDWLPKVDAFAGYRQFNQREELDLTEASDRRENVVGLRLSMNLFEGWNGHRESQALSAEAQAAHAEARYGQQEVEARLHGEIAELRLLHEQVHSAEANIQRAEKYHRLTKSEYNRGVKNSPDMLGAAEKLMGMKQKYLEILRDFQIAKSRVLSKVGR